MALSIDALSLQPAAAPVAPPPPRQPQVRAVGGRDGASNERRGSAKGDRGRASVAFRSFLNAATLAGVVQSLGEEFASASSSREAPAHTQRPTKLPDTNQDRVLSASETDNLYQSARVSAQSSASRAPEFRAATARYAKSFFGVSGTYARPGESLELTA